MKIVFLLCLSLPLSSLLLAAFPIDFVDSTDVIGIQIPTSFPVSRYTPHGYIDNPHHSMVLNRSGVIRSFPPLGFGYWCTKFNGAYGSGGGDHVNYLSLLNFGISIDGKQFITTEDFNTSDNEITSLYHTKHMVSYDFSLMDCTFSIKYFLPQEHSLAAIVEVKNTGSTTREIAMTAIHTYMIGNAKWWGSNGLSASYDHANDYSVTKVWAYGDVFVLGSTIHSSSHMLADTELGLYRWMAGDTAIDTNVLALVGTGPIRSALRYSIILQPRSQKSFLVCLSRGKNEAGAKQELQSALASAYGKLAVQLQLDELFWKQCPVLDGDWPEHWKRGWVYDFETLRMNVRMPIGIFKHPWDAMQIHSPRIVLGETSLDMMTLSYALPNLAKEVFYGTFADALAPNIPCVREDGSMNMISADGSECGTAPMWGYPFHMIKSIYLATGDKQWVDKLYPYLQKYIEWWLKHRTDEEGWLHCNNSWESGQDGSRRFLVAEQNEAAVADFVRTVDVEASMAEAMIVMRYFAGILNKKKDEQYWDELSAVRIKNTRSMLVDNWYRDVDARTKKPIILDNHFDVAMLAPLTCGIASKEQVDAVRPILHKFEQGHEWPPGLFTFVEAAWFARHRKLAAEGVAHTADRVYKRTDSRFVMFRDSLFSYRIPGVANEFWPEQDVPAGGENYGWGATLPMNIIRGIIGFREKESINGAEFYLAPSLPKEFMKQGKHYTIRNLKYRNTRFDVTYSVSSSRSLTVTLKINSDIPILASAKTEAGKKIATQMMRSASFSLSFPCDNEQLFIVSIE